MASNYEEISRDHKERYGTDVARYGQQLLVDRYDDRTHFIYELLQNAEDALKRRGENWSGSRQVKFELAEGKLVVSHYGHPFTEADVRSICAIAMSTKGDEAIGKFGIGFKSVYTFTDHPEIHSGDEDFAITHYVHPSALPQQDRKSDETRIVLPLTVGVATASADLTKGLKVLGPSALLFLRNITELSWSIEGGESGLYLRDAPSAIGPNVSRVKVIGQSSGNDDVDQEWLVFHKDVGKGRLEIAFSLKVDKEGQWSVQTLVSSPLVVYFPTAYQTNLGFLVQGPFLTTPSRDNIKSDAEWNHHLVNETAALLVEAMAWMRDENKLDVSAIRCLPLDRDKFTDAAIFGPMFAAVRRAFLEEPLLPRFDSGYVAAPHSKLARTVDLRELFSPQQVTQLFGTEEATWLSGEITQDRTPEIRQYVMRELGVTEVTPEVIVSQLTQNFLEAQSDEWISRLYEFLSGLPALKRRSDSVPLVRLSDGRHVTARVDGEPQAFLPSQIETGFPIVRRSVCANHECRMFLMSLGVTEPDPVDDVILNVLQRYRGDTVDVDDEQYPKDIARIVAAFNTDSKTQRDRLVTSLSETSFVVVTDAGDGTAYIEKPGNVYIATERLKQLFGGVTGVLIVNVDYDCLRGEDVRDLLVACGASRYLDPIEIRSSLSAAERAQIRKEAGLERAKWEHPPNDFTLRGLTQLLELLPTLEPEWARARAKLLWDSLADLEARGSGAFYGTYKWGYSFESKVARFDAAFNRTLNESAWIPDGNGELLPPCLVIFDSLGWKPNSFLMTKISFKPAIIDQLAKAAGIDPAALDLLRKLGITSVADLTDRLGILSNPVTEAERESEAEPEDNESSGDVYGDAGDLYGEGMPDIPPGTPDPDAGDSATSGGAGGGGKTTGTGQAPHRGAHGNGGSGDQTGGGGGGGGGKGHGSSGGQGKRSPGHSGGRPFISYVGAHPGDTETDPDGLDQATRMRIEEQALALIIELEPTLRRTAEGNPGFDLYEAGSDDKPVRWVEVKSMTGRLEDRPVGLSHTQFNCARECGDAYWLYVVEHATDRAKARVLRIQDPVARARTFTFDHGWGQIARTEPPA
jgi:hypothetical protein